MPNPSQAPSTKRRTSCPPHVVAQTVEGGYKTFRPDGPGHHPAVVFLPGCSGFAPSQAPKHYERVAEQFRGKGYVVIFTDYMGRCGLTNRMGVTHSEAAKDQVAAAVWLKSQPSIDPARITALGWSYGGGAVPVRSTSTTPNSLSSRGP